MRLLLLLIIFISGLKTAHSQEVNNVNRASKSINSILNDYSSGRISRTTALQRIRDEIKNVQININAIEVKLNRYYSENAGLRGQNFRLINEKNKLLYENNKLNNENLDLRAKNDSLKKVIKDLIVVIDVQKKQIDSLRQTKDFLSAQIQLAALKIQNKDSLITELKTIEDTLRRELMTSSFVGVFNFKGKKSNPFTLEDGETYNIKSGQIMKIKDTELSLSIGIRNKGTIKRVLPQPIMDFDVLHTDNTKGVDFNRKIDPQANTNIYELYKAINITPNKNGTFEAKETFGKGDKKLKIFRQAIKKGKGEYLVIRAYYTDPNTKKINMIKTIKCKIQ